MKKILLQLVLVVFIGISAFSQTQLSFRFSNPHVDGDSPQLFKFDVEVKASEAGTFLRDLQIYFDYNPLAFGSDIVANGKVTLTNLDLLADHYVTVNLADNTSSGFAAILEATEEMNQPGSPAHFNEVQVNYTRLLRFQIEIADVSQTTSISFDQNLMNGGQYLQSTGSTEPLAYQSPCIFENSLANLSLTGQEIELTTGWSGISGYRVPFDPNVENLFEQNLDELIILQNFSGVYLPSQNVNTLGEWNYASGYMIKVSEDSQVRILGGETDVKTINLTEGWNLIPVLSSCDVNTTTFFAGILPNLIIVKDVAGLGTYWPEKGINSLPWLRPGKAYFVKMAAEGTISFPVCN